MKFVTNLTIRPLGPKDAETFLRVHQAAVHGSTQEAYAPDILEAWSGPDIQARLAQYHERAGEEVRIGAFDGDTMAGLGVIGSHNAELRACYVHPDYGRMGVGAKIVAALEQIARGMGIETLWLESTINAERFYQSLGYTSFEHTSQRLDNGTHFARIKMRKNLDASPEVQALKMRNAKVEADKAWETSITRRGVIASVTYIIVALWLAMLGVGHYMFHALVPVAAYLVAMASLPMLKKYWMDKIYQKKVQA